MVALGAVLCCAATACAPACLPVPARSPSVLALPIAPVCCSGGVRRAPENSLLQAVAPGTSVLNALPTQAGPAATPAAPKAAACLEDAAASAGGHTAGKAAAPSRAAGGVPGSAGAGPAAPATAGVPSSAAAPAEAGAAQQAEAAAGPAAAAPAAAGAAGGPARNDSGAAASLPTLLLSPAISMPPSSLLPLPPLSVTSGAAGRGGAKGGQGGSPQDRLLQQQFRPGSSKLTDMFKPLEDLQAAGTSPTGAQMAAAATAKSPRTAAELRAAILRLAQQSPPAALEAAAGTGLLGLPPLLGLLGMPAAADHAWQPTSLPLPPAPQGLTLPDLQALDAARPAQHRCVRACGDVLGARAGGQRLRTPRCCPSLPGTQLPTAPGALPLYTLPWLQAGTVAGPQLGPAHGRRRASG